MSENTAVTVDPSIKIFQDYVVFVGNIVERYKRIGDLASGANNAEITPATLNGALADFYPVCVGLNAEYQRAKMEHIQAKNAFTRWWDEIFLKARRDVISEYQREEIRGVKPSVTEYEVRARTDNAERYERKKNELDALEAKAEFLRRLLDTLASYDRVLTTLSNNMRSEMFAINIDRRTNVDPSRNKVRRV